MSGEFLKGAVVATTLAFSANGAAANGYDQCIGRGGVPFVQGMDYTHRQGPAVVINGVPTQLACVRGPNIDAVNADKRRWLQQRGTQYKGNRSNAVPYQR